jgi:hypothetical protein
VKKGGPTSGLGWAGLGQTLGTRSREGLSGAPQLRGRVGPAYMSACPSPVTGLLPNMNLPPPLPMLSNKSTDWI